MTIRKKLQQKQTSTKNKTNRSFIIFAMAIALVPFLGWAGWQGLTAPVAKQSNPEQSKPVQFKVKSGISGNELGRELTQAGLIKSTNGWKIWTKFKQTFDAQGGFKAGTYEVSPTESLPEIARKIWYGEIIQTNFTIPEGWSTRQMGAYFADQGYFSAEEFNNAVTKIPQDKFPWLPEDLPILEGFLYPDTYRISTDMTSQPEAIINTMLARFEQVALPAYEAAKPEMSLLDWVTLSSIVEKESVIGDERALIAGVFTSRLNQGMRLESDPTVEYGLGIRQTADQPLTYAQVGTPSPYNTYLNTGLTPTPIASPGIASLKATLNPESTDYLFFVARYDGTHVFSRTLREHEAATREIRRQRNQ